MYSISPNGVFQIVFELNWADGRYTCYVGFVEVEKKEKKEKKPVEVNGHIFIWN